MKFIGTPDFKYLDNCGNVGAISPILLVDCGQGMN